MNILWDDLLAKYKWELFLALGALILIGSGLFWLRSGNARPDQVQILSATDDKIASASTPMLVDISGEVVTPGVYKLPSGARVEDAIHFAGGLSPSADTNWISMNLNRAEKVRDGMKIFIPAKTENEANAVNKITAEVKNTLININSADVSELDTLQGVGPATANKIISNRPYGSIEDLLSKKVVSQTVFDRIKERIRAW